MDADKQKALEAVGWKFGSVHEFLGERPMSDSDKILKAKQIISQWENHDKFRIPTGESDEEPDEVVVSKSLIEAYEKIKAMQSIIHRYKTGKGWR